jgi:hypothetical protein
LAGLPWLVVHGEAVWRAALVGLVVCLPLGLGAAKALGERRRARRIRSVFEGGHEGTIRVRDLRIALVTPGAVFAIEGPVEVLLGSREIARWRGTVRTVEDGDAVLALSSDRMRPREPATAGYRDDAAERVLESVCVAFTGRPRGPVARTLLGSALVGLALFAAIFVAGGEIAIVQVRVASREPRYPLSLQVAAATPLCREEALARLANRLCVDPRDAATLVHVLALLHRDYREATLYGGPDTAIRFLSRATEPEAVAVRAHLRYATGDFEAASDDFERLSRTGTTDRLAPRVHLLAGRLDRAARAALERSRIAPNDREAAVSRAVALAIAARQGDGAAQGALRAETDAPQTLHAVLVADLAPREERARLLRGFEDRLALWLRLEADPAGSASDVEARLAAFWPASGSAIADRHVAVRESATRALLETGLRDDTSIRLVRRLQEARRQLDDAVRFPSAQSWASQDASLIRLLGPPTPELGAPIVDHLWDERAELLRPSPGDAIDFAEWIRGVRLLRCLDCPAWRLLDDIVERRSAWDGGWPDVRDGLQLSLQAARFAGALRKRDIAVPLAVLEDL